MPLETGTFIGDLVTTNPPTSDLETQGANHLQLIKTVLQNTFGAGLHRFVGFPTTVTKAANYTVLSGDANTTFLVSTAGGAVTLTLPNTLVSTDAGWEISVVKTTTDTNPVFVAPAAGTMQSGEYTGLAKIRRCIPGRKSRIFWTGTGFIAERVVGEPIASIIDYSASKTLPVGFEWPNGQVLSSSANYPEYFALVGSGNTPDLRGRGVFGQDDMGGVAANRITVAGGNYDGTVLDNTGGLQNHTMTTGEMPAHGHGVTDPGHTHSYNATNNQNATTPGGGATCNTGIFGATTGSSTTGISVNSSGSGNAFTIMPPSMVVPKLLITE
jgi:microcystin-dependent protein